MRDHPTETKGLGLLALKVGAGHLLHQQRTAEQTDDQQQGHK
jgi:hypothetical protein